MVMSVNTNVLSLTAQRNMMGTQNSLSTSIERLSTGLRINSAKDDAAGLAIAERFTSSIRGLSVAQRNANDGISFAQTAEGALDVIGNNLQRIRELAVQSLNDSNTEADRAALDQEVQQLTAEVKRIAENTTFNGRNILDGSLDSLNFQIGAERGQTLAISGVDARASELSGKQLAVTGTQRMDVNFGTLTDITINGGAAIDLQSVTNRQGVIDAINNAYPDGTVQAKGLETKVTLGAFAAVDGEKVTIGSTDFTISTSGGGTNDTAAKLVASINASTELGDITASLDSSNNLVLTSASGADIKVEESVDGLLDGTTTDYTTAKTFTGGIEISSSLKTLTIGGTDKTTLGLTPAAADQTLSIDSVSVTSRFNANNALVALDGAIDMVTSMRADLGAIQNRFENVIEVAAVQNENLSAARSRIQDADFAAETANLTRAQILQQAGLASLAQANASPQAVLSLLG
jgi:flagellin